jgi:hypothetical protein
MSDIVTFLLRVLVGGPLTVKEIDRQALEASLLPAGKSVSQSKPWRTARNKLCIKPRQKDGQWWWELPAEERASVSSKGASGKACEGAPENGKDPTEARGGPLGAPVAHETRVAAEVARKPGGSKPGERRGGRAPGTPNRATAIIAAAMDAVAANGLKQPDITPLEFMLGMMADPKVDPSLRFKAAQASAMYVHPKPMTSPTDPADGAKMVINGDDDALRAKFEAASRRISELDGLRRLVRTFDKPPPGPLTAAEKVELEELKAWQADVPDHLKYTPSPNMVAILKGFRDNEGRASPAHPQRFEEPAERRQRLLRERRTPTERRGSPLLGDPEVVKAQQDEADEGIVWPADLRREDDAME